MTWNLDIAKDELNKLNVAEDLKTFLVEKTHEWFGVKDEESATDGLTPTPTESDAAPEGNDGDTTAADEVPAGPETAVEVTTADTTTQENGADSTDGNA